MTLMHGVNDGEKTPTPETALTIIAQALVQVQSGIRQVEKTLTAQTQAITSLAQALTETQKAFTGEVLSSALTIATLKAEAAIKEETEKGSTPETESSQAETGKIRTS